MLFNSYIFIFVFLPIVLLGFHLIGGKFHHKFAILWLILASLFFYGWWNPNYLWLIIASILVNYTFGISLAHKPSKLVLSLGIATNLSALAYFKYANFFVETLGTALDINWHLNTIFLPLAISFFTFQQIAYLVDTQQGLVRKVGFLRYCLFVTFFPQLIAGPIVHHQEMLPQFAKETLYRLNAQNIAVGITIFSIGLFKKTVIADGMALYATPVFDHALAGDPVSFIEGWGGALAYTFQLYFDFSGYSDMAVGLARMFGIRLPVNFYSPYKANNIIDFWRRWHMTLSRFLRDYLYIPLGGNRRRNISLMLTMFLGGLWHGAGWTFVAWGGLHGFYLIINHTWQKYVTIESTITTRGVGRILTFLAVVVGWVLFRAESWEGALIILTAMAGLRDFMPAVGTSDINWRTAFSILAGLLIAVWVMPNSYQILSRYDPVLDDKRLPIDQIWKPLDRKWKLSISWAYVAALVATAAVFMLTRVSEFLYFQF